MFSTQSKKPHIWHPFSLVITTKRTAKTQFPQAATLSFYFLIKTCVWTKAAYLCTYLRECMVCEQGDTIACTLPLCPIKTRWLHVRRCPLHNKSIPRIVTKLDTVCNVSLHTSCDLLHSFLRTLLAKCVCTYICCVNYGLIRWLVHLH
jgi:hypothetical protein